MTIDDIKTYLRVDHDDDDNLISLKKRQMRI